MENCENFRSFGFIYIYIYIYRLSFSFSYLMKIKKIIIYILSNFPAYYTGCQLITMNFSGKKNSIYKHIERFMLSNEIKTLET